MGWINKPECRYRLDILVHEAIDELSMQCHHLPAWALYKRNDRGEWVLQRNDDHEYVWACDHHKNVVEPVLRPDEAFFAMEPKWRVEEGEGDR